MRARLRFGSSVRLTLLIGTRVMVRVSGVGIKGCVFVFIRTLVSFVSSVRVTKASILNPTLHAVDEMARRRDVVRAV